MQGFVCHGGAFDGEAFHAEGGFEIAKFHLNLPALHVEICHFFGRVFLGIQKVGDYDKRCFFTGLVFVAGLDGGA